MMPERIIVEQIREAEAIIQRLSDACKAIGRGGNRAAADLERARSYIIGARLYIRDQRQEILDLKNTIREWREQEKTND